jgi:membrane AbrB-like protein
MGEYARIVVLLCVGVLGALLARRFRIPGGALLGALLSVGIVSLVLESSEPLPEVFRSVALLLVGINTGSTMDRRSIARVRSVVPLAFAAILGLVGTGFGMGWLLYRYVGGEVSLLTAFLGTMPGGASGLTALAYDLGADARLVASMHLVRLIIVFGALPLALRAVVHSGRASHGESQRKR